MIIKLYNTLLYIYILPTLHYYYIIIILYDIMMITGQNLPNSPGTHPVLTPTNLIKLDKSVNILYYVSYYLCIYTKYTVYTRCQVHTNK